MASTVYISDSEESEVDMLYTPSRNLNAKEPSQPSSVLSHRFRESPVKTSQSRPEGRESAGKEDRIAVMVSAPARPWEYQPFRGETTVDSVLDEYENSEGEIWYKIEYEDGRKEDVSDAAGCYYYSFKQHLCLVYSRIYSGRP